MAIKNGKKMNGKNFVEERGVNKRWRRQEIGGQVVSGTLVGKVRPDHDHAIARITEGSKKICLISPQVHGSPGEGGRRGNKSGSLA